MIFSVKHGGMWSLILHIEDNEWAAVILSEEEGILEDVYWFGFCKDDEME